MKVSMDKKVTGSFGAPIDDFIGSGDYEGAFREVIASLPKEELQSLWELLMEVDLTDHRRVGEQIYKFGSSLGAKAQAGRLIFTRLANAYRKVQLPAMQ